MDRRPIRVLVADDAVVVRHLLTTVINEDPGLVVAGVARNGAVALARFEQLRPDVVTLDIDMPEMDGLHALAAIRALDRSVPIVMFSTLTERGGEATLEALTLGASDYVTKPSSAGGVSGAIDCIRDELIPRIKALAGRSGATPSTHPVPGSPRSAMGRPGASGPSGVASVSSRPVAPAPTGVVDVVAIGASTGGPVALAALLAALPADFHVPIVVTQHMPAVFTRLLAQRIDSSTAIRVREAEDGDVLEPGLALIAPGDFHMSLERSLTRVMVRLDQGEPVNFCRPAVDVMFQSVAHAFGGDVLAVVLTGMGRDGREGCRLLKERGAVVIAQDEATSVVWGMPGAVVNADLADFVMPLDDIGATVARLGSAGEKRRSP